MNVHKDQINTILITGFLGAGKTTILNSIIPQVLPNKIGIIENDFGEVGIDGSLLKLGYESGKNSIEIIEINNGSIFCSCRHENFIQALLEYSKLPIDFLFIEASGIADPAPIQRDIDFISNQIEIKFNYLGSLCIIDCLNLQESIEVFNVVRKQVEYSQLLVLNKIELLQNHEIDILKKILDSINSKVPRINTNKGFLEFHEILDFLHDHNLPFGDSINTSKNSPLKLLLKCSEPINYSALIKFLHEISSETIRIKGFCKINERNKSSWIFIDGVRNRLNIKELEKNPISDNTELNIIFLKRDFQFKDLVLDEWVKIIKIEDL